MGSTQLLIFILVTILSLNFNGIQGRLEISSTTSGPGRSLLQTVNVSEPSDDTVRVDPLDNFKKYRGGFDITNKHYWSSTVFTGIHGYAIGVLWLLCGLIYGGFLLAATFCCNNRNKRKLKKRSPHCHKQCYIWPMLLAITITILAILGTGLVLGGNEKFHSRAKTVVNIIIDTANEATETIYNTTGAMKNISTNLEVTNGSSQATSFLTSTSLKLDSEAADIQRQARKNRNSIYKGLKIVYIVTIVTISFNLIAVIALSAFGILRIKRALHVFIVICWLLTVLCWFFLGLYFFLEKFEGDTCTALEDFQQDPYNSSLSSILPCNELLSAKSVLSDVSKGVYTLVNQVNENISASYSSAFQICNPFSAPPEYQYQPENCTSNSIKIEDIPAVLKEVTCSDVNCVGGIYVPAAEVQAVEAYTTSIQSLLNAYPGMEKLVECQSVKEAFSEILYGHCRPLKRNTRMVWAAMVFLSVIMMALVLIWIVEAHHQQKYCFSDGSVKPHSTRTTEPAEEDSKHSSVV